MLSSWFYYVRKLTEIADSPASEFFQATSNLLRLSIPVKPTSGFAEPTRQTRGELKYKLELPMGFPEGILCCPSCSTRSSSSLVTHPTALHASTLCWLGILTPEPQLMGRCCAGPNLSILVSNGTSRLMPLAPTTRHAPTPAGHRHSRMVAELTWLP